MITGDRLPAMVPAGVGVLGPLAAAGVLTSTDVQLAAWMVRAAARDGHHLADEVVLGAATASWAVRHGHSCVVLPELATVVVRRADEDAETTDGTTAPDAATLAAAHTWPEPSVWAAALRAAPRSVVRVVEHADPEPVWDEAPLVLWHDRLYLQRHWADECLVAAALRARAAAGEPMRLPAARGILDHLLPVLDDDGQPSRQRRAADAASTDALTVMVGGPGTGKTYTVARLLAALVGGARAEGRALRVALTAPTGKAAKRMKESLEAALAESSVSDALSPEVVAELTAVEPTTIHRLLGPAGGRRQRFRHDAAHPLDVDVVVVDETSMVSLPLLARLLDAVPLGARLVLVGDPDQLESVELGRVLADLVQSVETAGDAPPGPLGGRLVQLEVNRRARGPVTDLAAAIRTGRAGDALAVLRAGHEGVVHVAVDDPVAPVARGAVEEVVAPVLQRLRSAAEEGDAEAALRIVGEARILCAHRRGRFGVSTWNAVAEGWLRGTDGPHPRWYPGLPLLVTRNDHRLGLANGDTGVVVDTPDGLRAVFRPVDEIVAFDPVALADVETAYATTIHKSQGSEFPAVVVVVPPATSPLVGRELLYTAVTRVSRSLLVVGPPDGITACIAAPAQRMSGLVSSLLTP